MKKVQKYVNDTDHFNRFTWAFKSISSVEVTFNDFKHVLEDCEIGYKPTEFDMFCELFDLNNDKKIQYSEVVNVF